MARYIYVVNRGHRDLYEHLVDQFSSDPNVRVVLDRRYGERRRLSPARPSDEGERRWRLYRRSRLSVEEELRTRSYAIVTLPD
jgi:hypothetical protein